MTARKRARALVGEVLRELAENEGGGKGSIPGPVIGWLIKKGEIEPEGGKKKPKRKKREYNRPEMDDRGALSMWRAPWKKTYSVNKGKITARDN